MLILGFGDVYENIDNTDGAVDNIKDLYRMARVLFSLMILHRISIGIIRNLIMSR